MFQDVRAMKDKTPLKNYVVFESSIYVYKNLEPV
jgi:hypothetical protein